jgi:TolB-like protein/Tfp pilus assembly protein PilF
MGEVYRARHVMLGREVAIKTVNPRLAGEHDRRRLVREAQHAASLQHPGICTIHEVGQHGDLPFFVMELIEGRSLREIVTDGLPLLERALYWVAQIADALDHAHARGIIHRDLKSSNVMIDGAGRARVLDFGLSRRLPPEPRESTITVHGALAGTLSHMAPEVLRGERADVRSDVWSLGVLLYELTTGRLPFQGSTPFETSDAILHRPPRPIGRSVPLAVRLVIDRCLMKDPAARYQNAVAVRAALDAIRRRRAWPLVGRLLISARRRTLLATAGVAVLGTAAVLAGPDLIARIGAGPRFSTIALLPLENATGQPDAEFYAQGLTEALIEQLGSVADVRVISPASAARAAAMSGDEVEAARRLSADVVITGRLRRASDRVAVDLRIIDPAGPHVLWSDSWERSANQVLALQADAVRALAAEIRLAIRADARDRLAATRSVNPEAYEAYLRGRYEWNRRTAESLQAAFAHFMYSLELDPTWAPAHAALADCYNQFGTQLVGSGSPSEFRPRAAAAAIRALQIDPASAEAHATLGYVRHYEWQWDDAERSLRRAVELNPSYALARIWYANLLATRGRIDEALAQVFTARDLDPFSLIINTNVGWVLQMAGRHEEAVDQLSSTLTLDSTYIQARMRLASSLAATGRLDEARAQAERVLAMTQRSAAALNTIAVMDLVRGDTTAARAALAELLERARHTYVPPGTLVDIYARLGDVDQALAWMQRAFDERANFVVYMAGDSAYAALFRHPRYRELLARSGLDRNRWR